MSRMDKTNIAELLKEYGWSEIKDGTFKPPDSLWENKPESFPVCDALDLQNTLGDE